MNDQRIRGRLVETAGQCVKCGLCLPHCPTYRVRRDESESPRGRIALIQGLAEGALAPSPRLAAHLASCLACRACEVACPSLVGFGSLMDDARALQALDGSPWRRWRKKASLRALSSAGGARAAAVLAKIYRFVGLGGLIDAVGLPSHSRLRAFHRVAMQLEWPRPLPENRPDTPAAVPPQGLFIGCVAQAIQPGLSQATAALLAQLGYQVEIPAGQGCCGAMHRHNGVPFTADRLLAQNGSAFSGRQVIATASACAAELRAHPALSGTLEICRFLADRPWPGTVRLHPLGARVVVHEPCSQRNALRDGGAAYDLLQRIPQIELVPLKENAFCCGAAGTYLLDNPALSATLLAPKIDHLRRSGATILVTTNTGCALQLATGAREAGLDLQVLHPVELVAQQLVTQCA